MSKNKKCESCQYEMIPDPMPDMRKNLVCVECDFKPETIKKFVKDLFPPRPEWVMPTAPGYNPEKTKAIFEPKNQMNPYLADVFTLVDEDELAIRDGLLLGSGFKYSMLLAFARHRYTYKYAWAIPRKAALEVIAKYSPIVEVGAGSGYWAKLLNDMGVDIIAYDSDSKTHYGSGTKHHFPWFDVRNGDESVAKDHSDRALFLCWPPYATKMAANCLKNYKGDTVLFIGEWDGCTGDESFFKLLEKNFVSEEIIDLPVWLGLHDALYVFRRKKAKVQKKR
ncbi:MAG: hypothetical protein IPK68_09155 [Bdellovibrionales bacterium]|nr:hypothetical protein [Bdellovibrionales bacterium]